MGCRRCSELETVSPTLVRGLVSRGQSAGLHAGCALCPGGASRRVRWEGAELTPPSWALA